ncbi:MAG: PD-(D/E)XK nuclease family transposase [Acetatifactor sp.]|nr:PD-(D/E)XK nuclease family transposase [Acetatifactor sp.]
MTYDNFTPSAPSLTAVLGERFSSQDAKKLIMQNKETYQRFLLFPDRVQQKLLTFIEAQRGMKITYDALFHKIMSPVLHPHRLESFLAELMGAEVHIEKVLPREGLPMADETGIIIMDILLQLSDGSRVNVEMQKLGLYFPGERSNCYAADAIMRQYSELKSKLKDKFSYKMMKPFFLIILMEHSSAPFNKVSPHYIHNEQISYDSGAEVTSLIKTKYISLDTFRKYVHNINNKLHAWLTFFSSDEPEDILKLVTANPEFCELYQEIAQFRTKPEELIYMYSEALAIADRNTIRLMIDDMQEELTSLTNQVAAKNDELAAKENELAAKENEIAAKENEIAAKENEIAKLRAENEELKSSRQ